MHTSKCLLNVAQKDVAGLLFDNQSPNRDIRNRCRQFAEERLFWSCSARSESDIRQVPKMAKLSDFGGTQFRCVDFDGRDSLKDLNFVLTREIHQPVWPLPCDRHAALWWRSSRYKEHCRQQFVPGDECPFDLVFTNSNRQPRKRNRQHHNSDTEKAQAESCKSSH